MGKLNTALKNAFLAFGGNPSELADNQVASDYITDLENAIKDYIDERIPDASEVADDTVLAVVDGEWTLCTVSATADTTSGAVTFTFTPIEENT